MRCSEVVPLLLERILQHHSGDDLHHLLQGDVVGIPEEGRENGRQTVVQLLTLRWDAAIDRPSLLQRVDLQHQVVTADVFLQTSLQSPQHLHVEHYNTGHMNALEKQERGKGSDYL